MIGYARCSTNEQHLDRQIKQLEEVGCIKIFQEKISGTERKKSILERPALRECIQYLRPGDIFVVTEPSRISRNQLAFAEIWIKLDKMGIYVKDLRYGMDTRTPMGKMIITVLIMFAEMEADMISSSTKDGLAAARARGKLGGRPRKVTSVDKEMMWSLHQNPNNSIQDICDRFNISTSTFYFYINQKKRECDIINEQEVNKKLSPPEELIFKQQSMFS